MSAPATFTGFVGSTPVDQRNVGGYTLTAATETVVLVAPAGNWRVSGLHVVGSATVVGPVIVRNRGKNGAGTVQNVNYTVVGPIGTAWVPFFAPAINAGVKEGDVLTVAGVPAGTAVKLMYR